MENATEQTRWNMLFIAVPFALALLLIFVSHSLSPNFQLLSCVEEMLITVLRALIHSSSSSLVLFFACFFFFLNRISCRQNFTWLSLNRCHIA